MVMFNPGTPYIEKAIMEPREVGWMLRGITPALEFIKAIGRAIHPGELIADLNLSTKSLKVNDPHFSELVLRTLNNLRNQAGKGQNLHHHLRWENEKTADFPTEIKAAAMATTDQAHQFIPSAKANYQAHTAAAAA
jgi:hypothetical protein